MQTISDLPVDFDLSKAAWAQYSASPKFDYRIDYAMAVVDADVAAGRIEFLVRWAPNSYCHHHRHLGATTAVVIQGEQHITETRALETITKVRQAGFRGEVPDGEAHMECAGPDGLTMLFGVRAAAGAIFEVLDRSGNVLAAHTIADLVERISADAG